MINQIKKGIKYVKTSLGNISNFGIEIVFFQIISKTLPRLLPVQLRFLINPIVMKNQNMIMNYLYKHYGYVKEKFLSAQNDPNISNIDKGKRIWLMWLQGENEAPKLVKTCINSIKEENKNAIVQVITKENVRNYIDVPDRLQRLFDDGKVSATHYSDYCRVALLSKYGGIWIDSTMFMTRSIPDDVFKHKFYSIRASNPRKEIMSVARYRWNTFFMGGLGGNDSIFEFTRLLLFEYWKSENASIDYLLIDYAMNMACEMIPDINKAVVDTPLNNTKILWLERKMNSKYESEKWEEIKKSSTYVFKLTYKNPHIQKRQGAETYYSKFITHDL